MSTAATAIRPPKIRPGDRIAVVAPAGPVPREPFEAGARILKNRYQLVYSERIFARTGFLAGSDDSRLEELTAALADRTIRAVICARGGYGLMRIIDRLPTAILQRDPKLLVGFSDVTVLHAWAARAGVVSVHGPVVTQLGALPPADVAALFDLLESCDPAAPMVDLQRVVGGRIAGSLQGGNLELLSRLCGTPYAPPLDGTILLLEEVGERPYRLDRALTHLRLAGVLSRVRGIVVGDLVRCVEGDLATGPSAAEVVAERLGGLGIPLVVDAPVGHGLRNRALALGARVELDADAGQLTFCEAAVANQ